MGTYPPNAYLIKAKEVALFDAGYGDEKAVQNRLEQMKSLGIFRLAYIILSHAHVDHIGGAPAIKAALGGQIVVHVRDKAAANRALKGTAVDRTVQDGDVIELGGPQVEIIHTPGHSPGHLCLFLREAGVLFSGDTILGVGTTAIQPKRGDMKQYLDSLRKLLSYPIKLICPSHGPMIREPERKIKELIQHRLDREAQVLDCLRQGCQTVEEMVKVIYPELDQRLHRQAVGQIASHLIKLEKEKRVLSEPARKGRIYRLA